MYRIYINESVLIISESIPTSIEDYQQIQLIEFNFLGLYRDIKHKISISNYFVLTTNARDLFRKIKKSLKMIKAAGGVVRNENNDYLFILRKGKWDLPKGKIEKGETLIEAAQREVEEECSITIQSVGNKICSTYHVYELFGQSIFKEIVWYHMCAFHQFNLVPQLEENITEARWLPQKDLYIVKKNTYPSIKEVIRSIG